MRLAGVTVFCFFASYALALAADWARASAWKSWARITTLLFAAAGFVAHTAFLLNRSAAANLPPLLGSSQDWLLVLAWLMVLSYLVLTTFDRELAIGLFVLPLVILMCAASWLVNDARTAGLDALRGWKLLHASLLVLGMLGVLVGFVIALMYVVQQRRLKHREPAQPGMRIPSLDRLARLNRWAVLLAFPLLTLGVLTGVGLAVMGEAAKANVQLEGSGLLRVLFADPVVVGHLAVWAAMAALFVWLLTSGRTAGRQVALLTLWAGGFLLVTLLGLQILTGKKLLHVESWHGRNQPSAIPDAETCV